MMVFTIPEVLPIPIPGPSTAVVIPTGSISCQMLHRLLRPANGSDFRFANHTGEVIPVDGKVDEGDALVDQHALTGESAPAEKRSFSNY